MPLSESMPPGSGRRPTIYDIAARLQISPSTVSRALGQPGKISAATEAKVRAVADELGFKPNPLARALPTGRTGMYGLILPDITNPVHFELTRGVERVAREGGYRLLIAETQTSGENEAEVVARIRSAVDGIVLVASRLKDQQLSDIAAVTPTVGANMLSAAIPTVLPEISGGLTNALDHLKALGHRTIGYVGGPAGPIDSARWSLLLEHALARGMSIHEFSTGGASIEAGAAALPRVLAGGVTAVLTYNDLIAHGILQGCRAEGVDVPGHLSVIGFDDIFTAALVNPGLTTVRVPLADIGESAMRLLICRQEVSLELVTQLIVRESTGPAQV